MKKLLLVALLSSSCVNEVAPPASPTMIVDGEERGPDRDVVVIVPRDETLSEGESAAILSSTRVRRTVYLNGRGAYLRRGGNNSSLGMSSIAKDGSTVPPYEGSNAAWARLVSCVRDQYAEYDVDITDVDPGAAVHIEMIMGGRPSDITYAEGIWGVAPMFGDCSTVERAVGFVFTAEIPDEQNECETAAHEIGHTMGLEHEFLCEDPMTYLYGCGEKSFQDVDARCGEYEARPCVCGNRQNTHRFLTNRLGARTVAPVETGDGPEVALLSPGDGDELAGDTIIDVSAYVSSAVKAELLWQNTALIVMDCATPTSVSTCTVDGDERTWHVRVGTGARSFSVRATDAFGRVTTSAARAILLRPLAPPPVAAGPVVVTTSPLDFQHAAPGETVQIRATATSERGLASVSLWWMYTPTTYFHFTLTPKDGGYGINLIVPPTDTGGTRTLRIAATDVDGTQTVASDVHIVVD